MRFFVRRFLVSCNCLRRWISSLLVIILLLWILLPKSIGIELFGMVLGVFWDAPRSIVFDEVSFWVQCHNVPIAFLNKSILEKIASQIGVVEDVDEGDR